MQAVLKLAFVIFSGHTKPTFWSSVTYAPPDWEQGSLDQARPWPPWAMQTDPCLFPLQGLGTLSTEKGRAPAQALLPGFLSAVIPDCLGKRFIREAGFLFFECKRYFPAAHLFPVQTCRPPPLPSSPALQSQL